jgi:hypothetical protein
MLPVLLGVLLQPGVEMAGANQGSVAAGLAYTNVLHEVGMLDVANQNKSAVRKKLDIARKFEGETRSQIRSWYAH